MSEPLTMESLLESIEKLRAGLSPLPIRQDWPPFPRPALLLSVDPFLPTVQRPRKLSRWERLRCRLEDLVDGAELAREVYPWRRVLRTEPAPAPVAYLFDNRILLHSAHAAMVRTVYA